MPNIMSTPNTGRPERGTAKSKGGGDRPGFVAIDHQPRPNPHRFVGLSEQRIRVRQRKRLIFNRLLLARDLTYAKVAEMCALNHSYISRIVNGQRVPSLQTCADIAWVLGLKLEVVARLVIPDLQLHGCAFEGSPGDEILGGAEAQFDLTIAGQPVRRLAAKQYPGEKQRTTARA